LSDVSAYGSKQRWLAKKRDLRRNGATRLTHQGPDWEQPGGDEIHRGQDSLNPENDKRSSADCGKERMCASVIASCNAPPIFKFSKHVFNFMSLFIKYFIVFNLQFTTFSWRDTWLNAFVT
jgi:hypothetical protein